MLVKYTAVDDCIYPLGTEVLVLPAGKNQVSGANLLTNPLVVSTYTLYSSPTLETYGNIGLKLTGAGNYDKTITTVADTYYLLRAYVSPDSITNCRIYAGTTGNSGDLGITSYSSSEGIQEVIFKATGVTTYIGFQNQTGGNVSYWSSLEVLEVEALGVDETTAVFEDDFTSDITGWTDNSSGSGSIAWNASGWMDLIESSGTARGDASFTTVAGTIYSVDVEKLSAAGNLFVYIGTTEGASDIRAISSLTAAQTYTYYFEATGTTTYIRLINSSAGTTTQVDNVSITESGQRATNHDFSDTTNLDWVEGTGWTISGGTATHAAGTSSFLQLDIGHGLIPYAVTYTVSGRTADYVNVQFGGYVGPQRTADGTYTETITPTNTTTDFNFFANTSFDGSIDNVTIRLAAPDISANADGVEIHGEVVKVPVNYNSDTVAFTNFSVDNFVEQPYNSNMDYGVSGFHARAWFKNSGSSNWETVLAYGYYTGGSWSGAGWEIYLDSAGLVYFIITDDGNVTYDEIISTLGYDDNEWHQVTAYVTSSGSPVVNSTIDLYIDGGKAASQVSVTAATGTLTNTSASFMVGNDQSLAQAFDGQIALASTGATVPTEQQIKNWYEYEKGLFYKDTAYAELNQELTLEHGLLQSHPTILENLTQLNARDGSSLVATILYQKDGYTVTSLTIPKDELKYAKRFLKQARGQIFTFDERGLLYASIDSRQVVMESNTKPMRTSRGDFYTYTFMVRDTR